MGLRDKWQEHRVVQEELPFYRRTGFLAAAVFVAAVVAAGVVLLLTLGDDGENTATPLGGQVDPAIESLTEATATTAPPDDATSTTPPPADSSAAPPGARGCEPLPTDSGDAALTTAPEVEWSPVGLVPVALSPEDGPTSTGTGDHVCYSQTSAGALLAAHNFLADVRTSGDPTAVVEARMLPTSPTYDSVRRDVAGGDPNATSLSVVAYRFIEAEPTSYTVDLVQQIEQATGSVYLTDRITVTWNDDDWYVSDLNLTPPQVSSVPPGFIEWGPISEAVE